MTDLHWPLGQGPWYPFIPTQSVDSEGHDRLALAPRTGTSVMYWLPPTGHIAFARSAIGFQAWVR